MALVLQFVFTEGTDLEAIVMDASISEGHSFSADVTKFPVEKGSAVTDNVRSNPDMLRVEGFVSDFPLPSNIVQQVAVGAFTQKPAAELSRSQNVLDKLIQLKDNGTLITVTTGIRTYQNMVISAVDVNRDKKIRGGILMVIQLHQIRVVTTQTVEIVAKEPKGQNKQADGPKTTKEASPQDAESGSLITEIGDGFGLSKVLPK